MKFYELLIIEISFLFAKFHNTGLFRYRDMSRPNLLMLITLHMRTVVKKILCNTARESLEVYLCKIS